MTLDFKLKSVTYNELKEETNMVFEKVKGLLVEQLDVDADKVTAEALIIEELGADSLDIVEMLMGIEDNFDIKVADEDAQNFKTVGDVVVYIEEKSN